ncbi:hypothetical protein MC885_015304, partial [Smutsia gigantea]
MKSSENNAYFDGSSTRPFYVQAMAQQPYLSPWYQHPIYYPFSAPGAGVRYGSVCFPYAVMLRQYPGFLIPQSLFPTLNRGPVFYNTQQFQHYNGCGKEKKTECQTECQQSKTMNEKQDNHSEGDCHDIGRVASVPSTNTDRETDNIPEETRRALSCVAQKRELHGKSPGNKSVQRSAPQERCVSEGQKMRMEEGKGTPVIQFWKSLKETVRLYNLAYGKGVPENGAQHTGISQSSCENSEVLDNPHEGIAYKDDQRAGWLEQCPVRCEVLKAGSLMDVNLNKAGQVLSSQGEVKDRGQIHKTVNSKVSQSARGGTKYQQEKPFCSSNEGVKDLSLHSKRQNPLYIEGRMGTCSGDLGSPWKVVDEVVESDSYPEVCVSPAAWSAQFNKIDEGIQCDRSCWHEMEQKFLGSSQESMKGTVDSVGSGDLDIYNVILSDSYPELCTYSPARSPQMNRVHEGIQCDRCCWHGMEQRSPVSSPESSRKGTEESGVSRDLDEYEVLESDSCTDWCPPSPAWSSQVNRLHEGIQCDRCCWHGMEQRSPASSAKSGKGTVESGGSRDLDEYEVVESDRYSEMSALPNCVDVGIMCNVSLCQGEDVLVNRKETALIGEGPLADCRRKGSERSVRSRELVGVEVVERKSYPKSCGPSPTRSAQFNKVDEGIQCELSSQHDAELEKSSAGCKVKGSRKKSVRNRKVNTDGEVVMTDETAEVYNENFKKSAKVKKVLKGRERQALSSFSSGKAVDVLKKNAALNTVLPKDSEDSELEEGGEDEMDEVECLLEVSPDCPLTSSSGNFYGKAGRISRMPPESSVPQLPIWPTGNEYKAKHGDSESIPVVCKVTGQDGSEINCDKLQMECTVAKREGPESRRASYRPMQ